MPLNISTNIWKLVNRKKVKELYTNILKRVTYKFLKITKASSLRSSSLRSSNGVTKSVMFQHVVILSLEINMKEKFKAKNKLHLYRRRKQLEEEILQKCEHCHARKNITTCGTCDVFMQCATKIECFKRNHDCQFLEILHNVLQEVRKNMNLPLDALDALDLL